eukprot:224380_1
MVYLYENSLCNYNGYWTLLVCLQCIATLLCITPWNYLLFVIAPTPARSRSDSVTIKLVVVGDAAIGKAQLLFVYEQGPYALLENYAPTVFDNVTLEKEIMIDGENVSISLDLWDTSGQEEFDELRHISYKGADICLLCFSVVKEDSFFNVQNLWEPDVCQHNPDAMIILVGTQCELREDSNKGIDVEQIEKYRKQIGAAAYIETSAFQNINVHEAFETAITALLLPSKSANKGYM